uniref:Solute carrier family 22 member 6 n=1 Tax=Equus caballus TaxID=9796 RepID=A0A3Q2H114_HORSE
KIQSTLLILPLFLTSLHSILQNFTATIPTHHCRPPADGNLSKDRELEAWLPRDKQGQPESCLHFTFLQRGPPFPNGTEANGTGATEPCTNGCIYNNSTFPSNTWDLVCTHKTLPQPSQSIFMARTLVGSLMFGTLADRLGRQKVLIWTYLQLAVSGTCTGMATSPINSNSVTLSLEWLPIHARPCLGLLVRLVPSRSQFFVAGMAYAMPQWRHLQLLVSLPFFVFFIYSRFLIESALWYSSLGRLDLTLKAFWRVAQINGKQEEGAKLSIGLLQTSPQKDLTMGQAQPSMLQLLRSPAVRRLFLCLLPPWFANYFSIFGLVMSLQSFGINIYLLQGLFAVVDLPFYFLGFWAVKSLGRKPTQMASLLLSGIFILAYAMIPLGEYSFLRTTMAVLGKGCITGSINCLSIYTSELYPTVMRGQSMSGTLANTGSIVSPLVGMTTELHPSLPFFFYGAVPMTVCPIIVLLPETIGQPLPNTVLDLERRWKEKLGQKQQEQRGRE